MFKFYAVKFFHFRYRNEGVLLVMLFGIRFEMSKVEWHDSFSTARKKLLFHGGLAWRLYWGRTETFVTRQHSVRLSEQKWSEEIVSQREGNKRKMKKEDIAKEKEGEEGQREKEQI